MGEMRVPGWVLQPGMNESALFTIQASVSSVSVEPFDSLFKCFDWEILGDILEVSA